jgi:hypothetical protein
VKYRKTGRKICRKQAEVNALVTQLLCEGIDRRGGNVKGLPVAAD